MDIRWDHDREQRTGIPEVIFSKGKTVEQVVRLFQEAIETKQLRLATQLNEAQMDALESLATVDRISRTATLHPRPMKDIEPVGLLTGGTSDIPVLMEAQAMLTALGFPSKCFLRGRGGAAPTSRRPG